MAKRKIHDLILQRYEIEVDKFILEYHWSVPEGNFDIISQELGWPFDMHQLNHITQELFLDPTKHIDVIRILAAKIGILPKKDQQECRECLPSPPPNSPLPPPTSCSSCLDRDEKATMKTNISNWIIIKQIDLLPKQ